MVIRSLSESDNIILTGDDLALKNIKQIAELESSTKLRASTADRIADFISAFCGSTKFVYVHLVWFTVWIAINSPLTGIQYRFDPYPYQFLTLIVSLEAIFLSTFILISQNRQGRLSDRRNHLDLQINLLSEQENSKMLCMLKEIHVRLGISRDDPDLTALEARTDPSKLVEQIESIMENQGSSVIDDLKVE